MIKNENAGKGRFEAIVSKYKPPEGATPESSPAGSTENDPNGATRTAPTNVESQASSLVNEVKNNVDHSIKKRRHPAYKGDRIARTYKIPTNLDEWMHRVYEKEGIEIQVQVTKAINEWLETKYSAFKNDIE